MKAKTPEEKERDKMLDEIASSRNRCLSNWSFKKLVTYRDLLRFALGQDNEHSTNTYHEAQLNQPVSHKQIVDFFRPFEEKIKREYEASQLAATNGKSKPQLVHISAARADELVADSELQACEVHEQLPPSTKQKAFLFEFQERAGRKLLDGIIVHHKRGQLLRAAVGAGKTYIIGALARRLLDMKFCEGKTFSPWSMCWITRASIVEQTKRVLEEQFGICTLTEVQVINIESLRASFGDLMVRCETVIDHGEAHLVWKWRPGVHPLVFFIDESQFAKNNESQQSQIIQAISEIQHDHVYCVFFSATPLMRVCEAKYMVLNCRVKTKEFGTDLI